uniref:Venom protein n=1 Tax=Ampulex compressa TaxID=860918 RepID=A0A1W6EW45_AMPCP|nr:venom protein [Ampulex compressa]
MCSRHANIYIYILFFRELPINTYGKNNHNNIVCIEWRNNFERYL